MLPRAALSGPLSLPAPAHGGAFQRPKQYASQGKQRKQEISVRPKPSQAVYALDGPNIQRSVIRRADELEVYRVYVSGQF